ncbi:hypothetical protein H5410_016756 [Solanum commersonii]|uniref:Uncharacterized protein n=1 Tax=Solanum commersonii TaxID=4109 RepID=A0A9J5ZYB5_SOLCO|nr:hypothetical protein H5410_016756 [Solanum commersonii]
MVSTNYSAENTSTTPSPVVVPNSPTILTINNNEHSPVQTISHGNTNGKPSSLHMIFSTLLNNHQVQQPCLFINDKTISSKVPFASIASDIVPFVIDDKFSCAF